MNREFQNVANLSASDNDAGSVKTHKIDLVSLQLKIGAVELLIAEMPIDRSPFVLVHYAVAGKSQQWGHRLDLDKRAFLDSFEDGTDTEVTEAAHRLTYFLIPHRRKLELGEAPPTSEAADHVPTTCLR